MAEDPRHTLGKFGEDMACAELERLGYAILARRHRTRYGEIDIIARDAETTVFVEVKTRDGDAFGSGAESIAPWKQQRLARMAIDYAARHGLLDTPCRLDVVQVDIGRGAPRIEVYRNAFDVRAT
jgi:putative endonuclease